MKKFYEAPVVEFTGFSVEDVITTSATVNTLENMDDAAVAKFTAGVNAYASQGAAVDVAKYGSYQW